MSEPERKMMECGCVAQAVDGVTREAMCAVHLTSREIEKPMLEGRVAKCGSCKRERASGFGLAFFRWMGPRSPEAEMTCGACGLYKTAHFKETPDLEGGVIEPVCASFEPSKGKEKDEFYCGCRGFN